MSDNYRKSKISHSFPQLTAISWDPPWPAQGQFEKQSLRPSLRQRQPSFCSSRQDGWREEGLRSHSQKVEGGRPRGGMWPGWWSATSKAEAEARAIEPDFPHRPCLEPLWRRTQSQQRRPAYQLPRLGPPKQPGSRPHRDLPLHRTIHPESFWL